MSTPRFLISLAALWLLSLVAAAAEPAREFSATEIYTLGKQTITLRVFVDHDKVRHELPETGYVTILRGDKQVEWSLVDKQSYMEERLLQDGQETTAVGTAKYVRIGPDTVGGKTVDRYRMEVGGRPIGFLWADGSTIVQTQSLAGITVVYKDFKAGPQPAQLFEVPPGAKRLPSKK